MGYFSNGTEGRDYETQYCSGCVHEGKCPVWDAHYLYNYDQCDNENIATILGLLIPRTKDGTGNEECKMRVEVT